ncbi:MAG: glycosyltransferase family 39 protein [Chloroflexi bacterium]|nr:glycosyltransferase family 39 protein [Chloroflexota bacterium]
MTGVNKWLVVLVALAGAAAVLTATVYGAGASPDSMVYAAGARSLLAGDGFRLPDGRATSHHMPLYSLLLAGAGVFGLAPVQAARFVNALLFFTNILLVAWLAAQMIPTNGEKRFWLPLVAVLLIAVSPVMMEIHVMLWTEALFLTVSLLGARWLSKGLAGQRQSYYLAAAAFGLAFLTRYAGAALVAAGGAAFLLLSDLPLGKRLAKAAWFSILAAAPGVLWMGRNLLTAGTAANRQLAWHPPGLEKYQLALNTLASWHLAPRMASAWAKALPLAILAAAVTIALLRYFRQPDWRRRHGFMPAVLAVMILVYGVFLLASLTLLDANTPLDNRILSPVFAWGVVLIIFVVEQMLSAFAGAHLLRWMLALLGLVFIAAYTLNATEIIFAGFNHGMGFMHTNWRASPTVAALREVPPAVRIYSNSPEAIYFNADRVAQRLPAKHLPAVGRENPSYLQAIEQMSAAVAGQGAVVVWFQAVQSKAMPDEAEILLLLPLKAVHRLSDGAIYAAGE